jgi:hypothetical protein
MNTNNINITIGFGNHERSLIKGMFTYPYFAKPFLSAWNEHEIRLYFALREHPSYILKAMIKNSVKPEIPGTRSGYVIRFTCPECSTENAIVNKSPRDHYKETRDAACKQCKKRSRIITPGMHHTA